MKKHATNPKQATKDLEPRKGADVKGGGTTATTTTKPSAFEIKDWSFDVQQKTTIGS